MLATRVLLTRHAESADPTVFHGAESDVALGDPGHRQVRAAVDWFRDWRPTAVISSNQRRAKDTAAPIAAACDLTLEIQPRLHERIVGRLGGTPFSATEGPWADTLREWSNGHTRYATPGAESFDDLRDRLLPVWDATIQKHPGGRIVVVSHGVVCKVLLLCLLEGGDARRWHDLGRVGNLATSELIQENGAWRAERLLVVPDAVRALIEDLRAERPRSEA